MRPLAVVGNLSRDVVEGRPPRVGGGPYHAGRALRMLGRPARLVTKVAAADRALVRQLAALGLPVTWRAAAATAAFSFSYAGEERTMTLDGVGDAWTAADVEGWAAAALDGVEWVHVAPLLRGEFGVDALRALGRGRRLSLDAQGLVRVPEVGPLALDADYEPSLLDGVALLKLAEEEARVLGALDEPGIAALGVPEVVVTLGSRGSLVWSGGRLEEVAVAAVAARDPTGAGDAFAAGYVAARSVGHAPVAAARQASAVAAAVVTGRAA